MNKYQFAPLEKLELERDMEWCISFIENIFIVQKIQITGGVDKNIAAALTILKQNKNMERTLSCFNLIYEGTMEEHVALEKYTAKGVYGRTFDSEKTNHDPVYDDEKNNSTHPTYFIPLYMCVEWLLKKNN